MRTYTALAVVICCAVPQVVGSESLSDWPCFHGPDRRNKSPATGLLKEWPEAGPPLLWTASGLGKGYSSVSVAGGMVYTAGTVERQTHVFAFDLDGKQKWRKPNGQSWKTTRRYAVRYAGSRSTPTHDERKIYHLGELGRLAVFDAKTGNEIWQIDLFKRFEAKTPTYGLAESVLIDGDKLLCCPGGKKGYMVCLDKNTGRLIWANTDIKGTLGYSSIVIAEHGGFRQLLGMSAEVVFGVDAKTGKLLWSVEHGNKRRNNATDPTFHDGHVFVASGYGKGSALVKLAGADDGIKATKVWSSKLMDNHHGGALLLDGHVYGSGHQSRGWFCLNFLTGKQAWNAKGKGSLTYADGMLYCLEERGTMKLVKPTAAEHKPISSFRVPSGGSGLYWAHPVVCGGRLYVRHADKLFVYDIRAK